MWGVCGRYATTRLATDLSALFEALDETGGELAPDYNVAPTDPVPIVRHAGREGHARREADTRDEVDAGRESRARREAYTRQERSARREADARQDGSARREADTRDEPDAGWEGRDAREGRDGPPARLLSVARWGLVPHWATDPRIGARMINARAETVASAPAFTRAFRRRRCLVPADGWYEWRRIDTGTRRRRQAYFMTRYDGAPLAFAGLWAVSAAGVLTCAVVTTAAVGELANIHDRMPLLLASDRWGDWLDSPDPEPLLAPPPAGFLAQLELRPVGPAVGDVRNDGPRLIDRVSVTPSVTDDDELTDLRLF